VVAGIAAVALTIHAATPQQNGAAKGAAELLDGFRHVEATSVSEALEQVTWEKMYMSHRMRPIFPAKFAGFAVTVALKKESNDDPNASRGMLTAIDSGNTDSVYVVSVEDVLAVAEKMDFNEHSMYAYFEKVKSITKAVKKFGRL
jgi:hypothetical protein